MGKCHQEWSFFTKTRAGFEGEGVRDPSPASDPSALPPLALRRPRQSPHAHRAFVLMTTVEKCPGHPEDSRQSFQGLRRASVQTGFQEKRRPSCQTEMIVLIRREMACKGPALAPSLQLMRLHGEKEPLG